MTCLEAVDAWWGWRDFDYRRLWAPRFIGRLSPARSALTTLACRSVLSVYVLAEVLYDRSSTGSSEARWLSFLTVQGYLLVTVYFLSVTCIGWVVWAHASTPPPRGTLFVPPLARHPAARLAWVGWLRATQLIWSIALTWQVVIVVLYWGLLAQSFSDPRAVYLNVEAHGMKFLYIWLDFLLLGPNRVLDKHGVVVLLAAVGYLVWNLVFTFTVGPYVYPVLTWRGWGSAVLAIGALAFIVFVHYCVAAPAAVLRDAVASRVNGTVHAGAECCCCRCGSAQAGEAAADEDDDVERSSLYPRTFTDDALAFPCSSCACSHRRLGDAGVTTGALASAPAGVKAGGCKEAGSLEEGALSSSNALHVGQAKVQPEV